MKLTIPMMIAVVAAATVATLSHAQETFRCGSDLVSPGLTTDELIAKCGQPDEKEVVEEPIRARNAGGGSRVIGTATVEHWTYSRGQGQFPALLRIEEGELKSVEFLDRN
jgi:hypothetical protein